MQITLSCVILCLMLIIAFLYFIIGKVHMTESIKRLRYTIVAVEFILVSEIAILLVRERQAAFLAFTMYYISMAWLVFSMFRFGTAHAGYGKVIFYKVPFFWVTVLETIVLVWGYFSKEIFTITHIRWFNNSIWASRRFPIFFVYTITCIVILSVVLIILALATVKSAKLYRPKYFSVLCVLFFVTVFYCVALYKEQPLVVPVLCFGVAEIVIIYMAVFYAPKRLTQKALLFAADKLNDGIILYDDEHHLKFVTESFCQVFHITDEEMLEDEELFRRQVFEEADVENAWNGRVKEVQSGSQKRYYEIQNKELDDEVKSVGTVYWIKDVTEAIDNYEEMVRRANFDELTGIYNEAHFYETSEKVLKENPDTDFVMICSNVDKFRFFRELFGKEKAQDYIVQTAMALKNGLSQIPLCRYGRIAEDTFYVMMPKKYFKESDLIQAVDNVTSMYNTNNYNLFVRLGVYEIQDKNATMASICNRASIACDVQRYDYRKRLSWFDEDAQNEAMREERYNAELTGAIANGDITIYLQPQMDSEGKIIGAEALARWIHKEDGVIPPAKFIPLFEKNGRITDLDMHIWRLACRKLREWKDKGRTDLYISVNISAKDLYELDIYDVYMNLINEYGIDPGNLKLEITESAIINDLRQHISLITRLQKAGFEVEMDDFGSAYSSFNMLKDLCVDVLKIDMKFLGETENVERSRDILCSIVDLSKKLEMKTVAEGVETEGQYDFLRETGCDIYQGYYFSKPISTEEFEKKYF